MEFQEFGNSESVGSDPELEQEGDRLFEALELFNHSSVITDNCFRECVNNISGRTVNREQEFCIRRCASSWAYCNSFFTFSIEKKEDLDFLKQSFGEE